MQACDLCEPGLAPEVWRAGPAERRERPRLDQRDDPFIDAARLAAVCLAEVCGLLFWAAIVVLFVTAQLGLDFQRF